MTMSDESVSFPWMFTNIKRKKSRLGTHHKQNRALRDLAIAPESLGNFQEPENKYVDQQKREFNLFEYELADSVTEEKNETNHLRGPDYVAEEKNESNNLWNFVFSNNEIHDIAPEPHNNFLKLENKYVEQQNRELNLFEYERAESVTEEKNENNNLRGTDSVAEEKNESNNLWNIVFSNNVIHDIAPEPLNNFQKLENKNVDQLKSEFNFVEPSAVPNKKNKKVLSFISVKGKSYEVIDILGSGGSSVVYQVSHPETNLKLAIKRVKLSKIDEAIAEGYSREVKLLEKLQNCREIIKMYDYEFAYENDKNILSVVMEKGDIDLSGVIRDISETEKLDMPTIVYFWTGMLKAVDRIHKENIIHSDLKPANFLLVNGRLKLIDFGIASSMQGDMTSMYKDVFTGTLNYMSPEAVQCIKNPAGQIGYRISFKTDVWSLGCILYNLIYSKLPFQHIKSKWDKMGAIVDPNINVQFPEVKHISCSLIDTLKSCLNKDPKKRPSVSELLDKSIKLFTDI